MAKLPESNSLTPDVADALAENPQDVVAIVILRPLKVTRSLDDPEADETTTFKLGELEHFTGPAAEALLRQLRDRRAERTGDDPLPGIDSTNSLGKSTGDPKLTQKQVEELRAARAEAAAKTREKADNAEDETAAAELNDKADALEAGNLDDELPSIVGPVFLAP